MPDRTGLEDEQDIYDSDAIERFALMMCEQFEDRAAGIANSFATDGKPKDPKVALVWQRIRDSIHRIQAAQEDKTPR